MPNKLDYLTEAGLLAQEIHEGNQKLSVVGTNLLDIEKYILKTITDAGMEPTFKGYHDYPAASCLSVNNVIVHGIPYDYTLKEGDLLSIDFGVTNHKHIVDTARSYSIGEKPLNTRLINAAEESLREAIKVSFIGKKTGDIGNAVEQTVKKRGFYVVKELMGHGVGDTLQEPPQIPNHGKPNTGQVIEEGMVLAIEPIISTKNVRIRVQKDQWTIISEPHSLTTHTEDTIYISKNGPVILTRDLKMGKI